MNGTKVLFSFVYILEYDNEVIDILPNKVKPSFLQQIESDAEWNCKYGLHNEHFQQLWEIRDGSIFLDFLFHDGNEIRCNLLANENWHACWIGWFSHIKGVFLVSAKNAFVPVKHDKSVNTHSRISTVPRGSERS